MLLAGGGCEREKRVVSVPSALAPTTPEQRGKQQPGKQGRPVDYQENAYLLSEAKTLYTYFNCVGCHAHGGGGMGPPLMDDQWLYGSEPQDIFETIANGRPNGMPAFRDHLGDHQIWMLTAYVRSMSGLAPGDAAPGRSDTMATRKPENTIEKAEPKS